MNVPDFKYEAKLWRKGVEIVAGCDEVGRGCFAGPVVAAVVCFPPETKSVLSTGKRKIIINDSKKMTPAQRQVSYFWIRRNALFYGIGTVSVVKINRFGIKKASEMAFRKAVRNSKRRIHHLLIDAFYIPFVKGINSKKQTPIVKGDTKSFSIAAASIIAKVYRDRLMTALGRKPKYKKYNWVQNKGYGTKEQQTAIINYGVTSYHRKQFVKTFLTNHPSPS